MIKNVNFSDFCDTFAMYTQHTNNFTYEGKQALFNYLEELEEDIGEQITLDIIALCCEYSEYDNAYEAMQNYQPDDMPTVDLQEYSDTHNGDCMDLVEVQEASEKLALEWLRDRTQVIEFEGGVIIQDF